MDFFAVLPDKSLITAGISNLNQIKTATIKLTTARANEIKDINFDITSKLISLGLLENIEMESAIPNKKYDLLISLGGDGTLLSVAKNNIDTPIMGINTGHLGYLTVSNKDNLHQILK